MSYHRDQLSPGHTSLTYSNNSLSFENLNRFQITVFYLALTLSLQTVGLIQTFTIQNSIKMNPVNSN